MTDDEILAEFRDADARLEGHFILSSGLRSPRYLQCARLLMDPWRAERMAQALAANAETFELFERGKTWDAAPQDAVFLRVFDLLRQPGGLGLLATNTIAQGDTREVGLDQLAARGATIARAVPSEPWPGTTSLEVAKVWIRKGDWRGTHVLSGSPVRATNSMPSPGVCL